MFERRLKIFLILLFLFTGILVLRAFQLQVFGRSYWQEKAAETMKRSQLIETTRGRILDYRNREIAVDVGCIDACVDYRAITEEPDPNWVRDRARRRCVERFGEGFTKAPLAQRQKLLDEQIEVLKTDLNVMWATLAKRLSVMTSQSYDKCRDEIQNIREQIVRKVEMRRRDVWYKRYALAVKDYENREPPPWYRQWLIDEKSQAPRLDSFELTVEEQLQAHPILAAIDVDSNNELGKQLDRFPGLSLRPSVHRVYPFGDVACHVLGRLSKVTAEDLKNDPDPDNEVRQYYPNDLIGRSGVEALAERSLRGARGRVERILGKDQVLSSEQAVPGKDVRITIDIELQQDMQRLFREAQIPKTDGTGYETREMHGAAVVIDVPTGQVRALVSNPTFDLNRFDELYDSLLRDYEKLPLLNRATQAQLEPGSTVKPIVGIGAITQGLCRADEGIECTGFLVLNGRKYSHGRCWTQSIYGDRGLGAHHQIPWEEPHPTGWLTLADAVQRSCNIYFETLADRLKMDGLSYWYSRFGLGRPTGLGIPEASGRLPNSYRGPNIRFANWTAGIGQGPVAATPVQMANVAATLARNGIWKRPSLVVDAADGDPSKYVDADGEPIPAEVDLKLNPAALAAARDGMIRVVNSRAGTGKELKRDDLLLAGKTGTAQAAKFSTIVRDAAGKPLRDDKGRLQRKFYEPDAFSWYLGSGPENKSLNHAWYIGFAPAENPKIAFAVLVEYGGSGGRSAAKIASGIIEAALEHGYLQKAREVAGN